MTELWKETMASGPERSATGPSRRNWRLSDKDSLNDVLTVVISIVAAFIVAGATDFALAALATLIGLPVAMRRISGPKPQVARPASSTPSQCEQTESEPGKCATRNVYEVPLFWRDLI